MLYGLALIVAFGFSLGVCLFLFGICYHLWLLMFQAAYFPERSSLVSAKVSEGLGLSLHNC
jgi:hypothetical protein